jgi:hypothetical protein
MSSSRATPTRPFFSVSKGRHAWDVHSIFAPWIRTCLSAEFRGLAGLAENFRPSYGT